MRFEIKGGGIFAILLALAVLSGVVFFCGLLAGYDVGRQSQSATADVATTYTIPSAPLAALAAASPAPAAPAPVTTPAAIAANENPPPAANDDSEAPPTAEPEAKASSVAEDDSGETVAAKPSPAAEEHTETASVDTDHSSAPDDTTSADGLSAPDAEAPPPPLKRHAFNVQIQAVMDMSGANQMIRRLQRIGYPAHMVATPIDGQTWYKVEVGPYPSQDKAAAAQVAMRQKYNDTYGGGHSATAGSSPAGTTSRTNSDE
jgi:DedD protein